MTLTETPGEAARQLDHTNLMAWLTWGDNEQKRAAEQQLKSRGLWKREYREVAAEVTVVQIAPPNPSTSTLAAAAPPAVKSAKLAAKKAGKAEQKTPRTARRSGTGASAISRRRRGNGASKR